MWRWSAGLLVAAVLVLSWKPPAADDEATPPDEAVVENRYERAWRVEAELNRELRETAVAKLRAGEFATDVDVLEFLAEGAARAEAAAWDPVIEFEANALNDGQWTAELHAAILEGRDGLEADDGSE